VNTKPRSKECGAVTAGGGVRTSKAHGKPDHCDDCHELRDDHAPDCNVCLFFN